MLGSRQFAMFDCSRQAMLRRAAGGLRTAGKKLAALVSVAASPDDWSRMGAALAIRWLSLAIFILTTLVGPFGLTRQGSCCSLQPGKVCRCTPASRARGECCCQRQASRASAAKLGGCCQARKAPARTAPAKRASESRGSCCEVPASRLSASRLHVSPCPCGGESTTWLSAASQPRIAPRSVTIQELTILSWGALVVDERWVGCDRAPPAPPPRIGLLW